jgi:hypothetical protein
MWEENAPMARSIRTKFPAFAGAVAQRDNCGQGAFSRDNGAGEGAFALGNSPHSECLPSPQLRLITLNNLPKKFWEWEGCHDGERLSSDFVQTFHGPAPAAHEPVRKRNGAPFWRPICTLMCDVIRLL